MSIYVSICFCPSISYGCRYTVREAGFVDLGSDPYRLYYFVQPNTPKEFISTLKEISYAHLIESNVRFEIINMDKQKGHPALEYLQVGNVKSFPAAVLVSPKRQSLVLPISISNKSTKETVQSTIKGVVSSPKRDEFLQHIMEEAFCIVLLIQGRDATENKRIQEIITHAMDDITKAMSKMAKPYDHPPHLIVIPPDSFSQEKILLWSLGLKERELGKPFVTALYGRGRQIGPLLESEKITRDRLFNILSVVGADCSCELDRNWIKGPMIPLKWEEKIQSKLAKLLGFDPENPMVKMEVSQILSTGEKKPSLEATLEDTLLYGYKEDVVEYIKSPNEEDTFYHATSDGQGGVRASVKNQKAPSIRISVTQTKEERPSDVIPSKTNTFLRNTLFITGGVILLGVGGGLLILKIRRRQF